MRVKGLLQSVNSTFNCSLSCHTKRESVKLCLLFHILVNQGSKLNFFLQSFHLVTLNHKVVVREKNLITGQGKIGKGRLGNTSRQSYILTTTCTSVFILQKLYHNCKCWQKFPKWANGQMIYHQMPKWAASAIAGNLVLTTGLKT